ncbi:MAG: PAS domain S-box protein [Anaerolineae bacterium]|nr:PAS domain S-box protein [Anaerolineae bacterium]
MLDIRINKTETEQYRQAFETLYKLGEYINSQPEMSKMLRSLMEISVELLDADQGGQIYLYDAANDLLTVAEGIGAGAASIGQTLRPGEGMAGRVFISGKPLTVDIHQTDLEGQTTDQQQPLCIAMGVPLRWHDQIIGVMEWMANRHQHFFGPQDVQLAEILAQQTSVAISNARLRQERESLKVIVDNADDGILFTGPDGKIEYANPVWERITGYHIEELLGKTLRSFMEKAEDQGSEIMSNLRRGEIWQGEISVQRLDGSEYDALISITPVMDQQGQIANAVAVLRDITYQKQLEKMRKRYVANVSHELRTPVTNLKLYHGLLGAGPPESRESYMNTIAEQIGRLEHLVEDLLNFSRLDRGVFMLRPSDFSLNDLVQDVLRAHMPQAEKQGVQLATNLPPDLPLLRADRHRIVQVLSILVVNAINYTLPGGQVGIATNLETVGVAPCLTFSVWDTGVGIAPQDLPFVFERFFRAENARATGVPGTGLGLSIAKEIIDLHHGRIRVESSLSKGSSFTIYLPVQQSD